MAGVFPVSRCCIIVPYCFKQNLVYISPIIQLINYDYTRIIDYVTRVKVHDNL